MVFLMVICLWRGLHGVVGVDDGHDVEAATDGGDVKLDSTSRVGHLGGVVKWGRVFIESSREVKVEHHGEKVILKV